MQFLRFDHGHDRHFLRQDEQLHRFVFFRLGYRGFAFFVQRDDHLRRIVVCLCRFHGQRKLVLRFHGFAVRVLEGDLHSLYLLDRVFNRVLNRGDRVFVINRAEDHRGVCGENAFVRVHLDRHIADRFLQRDRRQCGFGRFRFGRFAVVGRFGFAVGSGFAFLQHNLHARLVERRVLVYRNRRKDQRISCYKHDDAGQHDEPFTVAPYCGR